ncbi:DNA cytosine methyltransferase [Agrobacterium pusense]|uniref:DNA cytosine methyltransferase n=1 Tax=Agrobacterium pusense TaxID=648995 RepID=UPI003D05908D
MAVCPRHLNLISICTGGFGLDIGVELAIPSARTVCMVEREAFSVATLVSAMERGLLHPAPVWSDARTFNGRAWRGTVDGLIGGIPCQPHSLAGRKQGQNDERDLWSDARRIIVQSGAWFVLIENVSGMLSAGADEIAGAERVCRDLHKLGFSVEGGLFTASEVGAPHQRGRVFILAVANPSCSGRCPEGDGSITSNFIDRGSRTMDPTIDQRWSDGHRVEDSSRPRDEDPDVPSGPMGHADSIGECEPHDAISALSRKDARTGSRRAGLRLFPPIPSDNRGWIDTLEGAPELEPAFRRMADGLAPRLDIARVDRLRMLGNGVVPLEAAYALRTLITRLAGRGSSGAARLVRMMEGIAA